MEGNYEAGCTKGMSQKRFDKGIFPLHVSFMKFDNNYGKRFTCIQSFSIYFCKLKMGRGGGGGGVTTITISSLSSATQLND